MEKKTLNTVMFLKAKTSKRTGKPYFSVANVTDGHTNKAKFEWLNTTTAFLTKKGDIVICKRIEQVEDEE